MIISLDGADGSGKSTVMSLLYDYLTIDKKMSTEKVIRLQHPGGTSLGQALRKVVKNPELKICPKAERFIFVTDAIQFQHEYAKFSADGGVILIDRYLAITDYIYGHASGLDLEYIERIHEVAGLSLLADYYFVLNVSPETAAERMRDPNRPACRIEQKGIDFMKAVATAYAGILNPPLRDIVMRRAKHVVTVDAERPAKEVRDTIIAQISSALKL